jgi:hypothetical protein
MFKAKIFEMKIEINVKDYIKKGFHIEKNLVKQAQSEAFKYFIFAYKGFLRVTLISKKIVPTLKRTPKVQK